jgi:iron complex transport system substrate-binding protein
MNRKNFILSAILLINIFFCNNTDRIVTIGGCVTETVFKLGMGNNVVAVDQSSTYPEEVKELPQTGYIRAISSEGILSMMPDLILTTTDMGPPNVVKQIKNSGVNLNIFNSPHSFEEINSLIDEISNLLNANEKGSRVKKEMSITKKVLDTIKDKYKDEIKIVFFMNPKSNSFNAAGDGTRADYLIDFIGGSNIFKDQFTRYKKVTKEEILNLNPDIILIGNIFDTKEESIFITNPEFQYINAVKNHKIFSLDMGKYLTFGPSFVNNALELTNKIHDTKD